MRAIPVVFLILGLAGCSDLLQPPVDSNSRRVEQAVAVGDPQVSVSGRGACVVREGVVRCWDLNGDGMADHVAATGEFTQVSSAYEHTCALRSDGAVECWGSNEWGKAPALRTATVGSYTFVSAGSDHSCAVRTDGAAECWGGNSDIDFTMPPVVFPTVGDFTELVSSYNRSCGLRTDGVIECFRPSIGGSITRTTQTANVGTFTQISANCGLRTDGIVQCGATTTHAASSTGEFVQFGATTAHGCGVRTDGVAECWGANTYGQAPATRTAAIGTFVQLSAGVTPNGRGQTCGVRSEGSVECWGWRTYSEPPNYSPADHTVTFTSSPPSPAYATQRFGVSATSDSGSPVTFHSYTTTICTVLGDTVRLANAGTCTIVARSGDNMTFRIAEDTQSIAVDTVTPAPPTSLAGTAVSPSRIDLTWTDGSSNEGSFRLDRRRLLSAPSTFSAWETIAEPLMNSTSYSDTGLLSETTYQYRIRACSGPCSAVAQSSRVTTLVAVPNAPANFNVTANSPTQLFVAWTDMSNNESEFLLQRRLRNPDGEWQTVLSSGPNVTSYTDNDIKPDSTYQYRLRACNSAGCSAYVFAEMTAPSIPNAPSNFVGVASREETSTVIDLTWTDNSDNEVRFTINRRVNGGAWALLISQAADSTHQRDSGIAAGTTYQYRVRSCNSWGCSAWVTSAPIVIPNVPATPAGVTATAVSSGQINVTWSDVGGETHYSISRKDRLPGDAFGPTTIGYASPPANATSYSDMGVTSGREYQYNVRACNVAGCSPNSTAARATTP